MEFSNTRVKKSLVISDGWSSGEGDARETNRQPAPENYNVILSAPLKKRPIS